MKHVLYVSKDIKNLLDSITSDKDIEPTNIIGNGIEIVVLDHLPEGTICAETGTEMGDILLKAKVKSIKLEQAV